MIQFKCECGKVYQIPNRAAGKVGKCKQCGNRFQIPLQVTSTDLDDEDEEPADPPVDWFRLTSFFFSKVLPVSSRPPASPF